MPIWEYGVRHALLQPKPVGQTIVFRGLPAWLDFRRIDDRLLSSAHMGSCAHEK